MSDAAERATELRVSKDRRTLTVTFAGGERFAIPAELLRVLSPSAEVQGHSPEQRRLVAGKRNVTIADIRPTGNYAVRIIFDDRHDTGIYSWAYLRRLGANQAELRVAYEAELADEGLSRDG
ncbi:MAG: hypothetical protein BroJett030_33180 [Alphaproteobacteria bacterium]|nr:MAG: hypothetical protein BroJett030_33180 [Alphaproteobacteria bacterium]